MNQKPPKKKLMRLCKYYF